MQRKPSTKHSGNCTGSICLKVDSCGCSFKWPEGEFLPLLSLEKFLVVCPVWRNYVNAAIHFYFNLEFFNSYFYGFCVGFFSFSFLNKLLLKKSWNLLNEKSRHWYIHTYLGTLHNHFFLSFVILRENQSYEFKIRKNYAYKVILNLKQIDYI